jgi:hypothetical protein
MSLRSLTILAIAAVANSQYNIDPNSISLATRTMSVKVFTPFLHHILTNMLAGVPIN